MPCRPKTQLPGSEALHRLGHGPLHWPASPLETHGAGIAASDAIPRACRSTAVIRPTLVGRPTVSTMPRLELSEA